VTNFAKVDASLWRGSQPTAEGFRSLEKLGVKTIVSFRHDHDDLPLLKGTKLKYLRLPSRAYRPKDAQVARFLKIMQDPANAPVFIHCAQGRDRTGFNAAAYRMVLQGWSAEDALAEMKAFRFNQIWMGNPGFLRKLDLEGMKKRVEVAPLPEFLSPQP
jgi:protein tyrosine/serine phosphatase